MPINPQTSREARAEIGKKNLVAASSLPPLPPIPCGPRDLQPSSSEAMTRANIFSGDFRSPRNGHRRFLAAHPAPRDIIAEIRAELNRKANRPGAKILAALRGGDHGWRAAFVFTAMLLIATLAVLA